MHAGESPELTDIGNCPPTPLQRRLVFGVLLLDLLLLCGVAPIAERPVSASVGIVAMYGAGQAIVHLIIGLLLFGQAQVRRTAGLDVLALGYVASAVCAGAYTILFPGLLSVLPMDGDAMASDWLYIAWHGLFALCVLGYAVLAGRARRRKRDVVWILGLPLVAAAAIALGLCEWLPSLSAEERTSATFAHALEAIIAFALFAVGALLVRRPRMRLDLWLFVAMGAWLLDLTLAASFNMQAFDLGFYIGRMAGLAGSLCLLGALAGENIRMNGRLRATFDDMLEARAREQSNALLAAVLRQLPEGVFILDCDGGRPIVNEHGARMAADGDLDVMAMVGEQARRAAAGDVIEDALMEDTAGGKRRVFSVSAAPVRDGDGSVAASVVVVDDVTARTEADQALRRALDRTRALLENTPLAAIEWGPDRLVRMWSYRAERLFGWRAPDVVGRPVDAIGLVHPDNVGAVGRLLDDLLHGGAAYVSGETRNLTRDGRTLCCEWHNSVLRGADGHIDAVFSLVLDVTERTEAMAQLREADQRKDVFIATLAHELRNPLAPIANAASLLLSPQLPPERIAWMAAMIGRQSARMARLLEDLLDVSRIGRGKIELRRVPTELNALLHEALQTSMPLIEGGRHRLDLAPAPAPVWVDADPVRIAQVMSNLINNAAKYTPPGGRIGVRLIAEGDAAAFAVEDNGIGIEPAMLDRVFDAFVQVGSASHMAQGGLGIGLSLSRALAELHGGALTASSAGPGCGSTFTLRLPLMARGADAAPSGDADAGFDFQQARLDLDILLADDNVDAAESLALLLRARGARVDVAHDGEAALGLFEGHPCDVAILDLGMPRMDGLELARRLARARPRPCLIALTGRGRKEDRAASLDAGFDHHLTKPVEPAHLADLLRGVAPSRAAPPALPGLVAPG